MTITAQLDLASRAHDTASATARATMERELRDRQGRWARTLGGESGFHGRAATAGSGIQERVQAYVAGLAGKIHPRELDSYSVGTYKRGTLNPAYHYTPEQAAAIRDYTDHSAELNADQRGESPVYRQFQASRLAAEADQISSAMHPLPDDMILLRELSGAHRMDGMKPGDVIADDGFASTTLTAGSGRYAAGRSGTTVMHIMAPAGTPSVWTSPAGGAYPEDEMILDRGTPMVMMRPPALQPGRSDVTDVYVLALPKQVAPHPATGTGAAATALAMANPYAAASTLADRMDDLRARVTGHVDLPDIGWPLASIEAANPQTPPPQAQPSQAPPPPTPPLKAAAEAELVATTAGLLVTALGAGAVVAALVARFRIQGDLRAGLYGSATIATEHPPPVTGIIGHASAQTSRQNLLRRAQFVVSAGRRLAGDIRQARAQGKPVGAALLDGLARERRYYSVSSGRDVEPGRGGGKDGHGGGWSTGTFCSGTPCLTAGPARSAGRWTASCSGPAGCRP